AIVLNNFGVHANKRRVLMSDLLDIDQVVQSIPTNRDKPKTYSVDEAARLLGVNRMLVYQEVWKEEMGGGKSQFSFIRVGRRILLPAAKLDEMLGLNTPPRDAA